MLCIIIVIFIWGGGGENLMDQVILETM